MNIVEKNLGRMENGLPPAEGWKEWAKHQIQAPKQMEIEVDRVFGIDRSQISALKELKEYLKEELELHVNNPWDEESCMWAKGWQQCLSWTIYKIIEMENK